MTKNNPQTKFFLKLRRKIIFSMQAENFDRKTWMYVSLLVTAGGLFDLIIEGTIAPLAGGVALLVLGAVSTRSHQK